jgi:predicted permease
MVLVVLAGLFTKSLTNVMGGDPGIRTDGVIMFSVAPDRLGYSDARSAALFERIESTIAAIPGVSAVASSTTRLLSGDDRKTQVFVKGGDARPVSDGDTGYDEIGSGYFRTLGVPVIAGRDFNTMDADTGPRVAIVNERLARNVGLGNDAVGKHISRGTPALDLEIVGVVRDFKQSTVTDAAPPMVFVPYRQGTRRPGYMVFYTRGSVDLRGSIVIDVRRAVHALEPKLPIEELRTIDDAIRGRTTGQRVMSVMTTAFALLALGVAAIGIYGLLAHTVRQRTPEIGVRMALGATRHEVRWMILRQVAAVTVAGGAVGLTVALLVGRLAQRILIGLQFHDATVIVSSVMVLALAALVAGYLPAHRAAGVDPIRALKFD